MEENSTQKRTFILDRMLGRLMRWLRLCGYDATGLNPKTRPSGNRDEAENREEDDLLIRIARSENRTLLSRDRELIKRSHSEGIDALLINSSDISEQLIEMITHFNINLDPEMTRCSICNSLIRPAVSGDSETIRSRDYVYPDLLNRGTEFWICDNCGQVYWQGAHWENIQKVVSKIKSK